MEVTFEGPAGILQGYLLLPDRDGTLPGVVVCHPHPLMGGDLHNNVVVGICHQLAHLGIASLSFNFRGVGRSQGTYDNGIGELTDAAAALDWLQAENPTARTTWIAGFSFGAWLALQLLMRRPEISGFVAISPPASLYDFSFLAPCPSNGLIIQGTEDKIVEEECVTELVEKLNKQKNLKIEYRKIPGADHFFAKSLDDIQNKIEKYISKNTN